MLVDWSQRIPALQHGVDVSHCQLFESNVTTKLAIRLMEEMAYSRVQSAPSVV